MVTEETSSNKYLKSGSSMRFAMLAFDGAHALVSIELHSITSVRPEQQTGKGKSKGKHDVNKRYGGLA
eukprot:10331546-Karenia_brevis.AAC.1